MIDLISESKKLVVGHNLFLDLVHTLDKFRNTPPLMSSEFKKQIQQLFPIIIDTKYMATRCLELHELFVSSTLGEAFQAVCKEPFGGPSIECGEGYAYNEEAQHQAGYDAYMTGFLFIKMAQKLQEVLSMPKNEQYPLEQWLDMSVSYVNMLHMTRSDCSYYLAGDDVIPDRSHIFYVHDFPVSTRTWDLIEYYNRFGKLRVQWIDETSAFLVFSEEINPTTKQEITKPGKYKTLNFEEYCKRKQQEKERLASPKAPRTLRRKRQREEIKEEEQDIEDVEEEEE